MSNGSRWVHVHLKIHLIIAVTRCGSSGRFRFKSLFPVFSCPFSIQSINNLFWDKMNNLKVKLTLVVLFCLVCCSFIWFNFVYLFGHSTLFMYTFFFCLFICVVCILLVCFCLFIYFLVVSFCLFGCWIHFLFVLFCFYLFGCGILFVYTYLFAFICLSCVFIWS